MQYVNGNIVFISEYEMPEQIEQDGKMYKFECVWQGELRQTLLVIVNKLHTML